MDNQHRHITGYRDLTRAEIDLMNRIKAHAEETRALVAAVRENFPTGPLQAFTAENSADLAAQLVTFLKEKGPQNERPAPLQPGEKLQAPSGGDAHRWLAIADDHLQQGFMALTRAVAQPTSY